jgi:hypothetical protein
LDTTHQVLRSLASRGTGGKIFFSNPVNPVTSAQIILYGRPGKIS